MNIPILFWVNQQCVLSLDHASIHPNKGDTVRIDVDGSRSRYYYKVTELVWSFRQMAGSDGGIITDNRLEVHLVKK